MATAQEEEDEEEEEEDKKFVHDRDSHLYKPCLENTFYL
jgi:hypothetical protein